MATAGKKRRISQVHSSQVSYVEGAVIRIKLDNFVTYDAVEFRPGPHLNVIIGPNGTGKSSIVCAICLGLAGKTSFLGRAQQPSEYIKHGCQRATVELELYNADGDNYIVKREINRNNQSQWLVNGRPGTQKSVEELVSRLNIQIGNLCQFLPQEKVADFAKMTPQELLENTEKAVGPQDMFERHCKLKSQRDETRKLELAFQRTSEKLEQETQQNARLEQDVKNYEERLKYLEQVKLLQMKRPWLEYSEKRAAFLEEKSKKQELANKIKEASSQNAPLRKRLENARKNKDQVEKALKSKQEQIKKTASLATSQTKKIEDEDDLMTDVQDDLKQKKQEDSRRKRKLTELQKQKESLESDLANLEEENVQPELERVTTLMRQLNQEMNSTQRQGDQVRSEFEACSRDVQGLQEELRRLQDRSNQRLQLLRRIHKDTFTAVQWLRANKHLFKGTIHEPPMLTINVKESKFAKYVERHISFNDMRAFVCEDKDDMELFLRTLRDQQKLKISAVSVPPEPVASFRPPRPIEAYRNYGFTSYLRENFECPDGVMRFLCRMYNVHSVPIGSEQTKKNVQRVTSELPHLSLFYTENHQYRIKKSKYADVVSSRCTELKDPRLLAAGSNQAKEQEIRSQLQERQAAAHERQAKYKEMQKKYNEMEKQMNTYRQEKKTLMDKKNMRITLTQRIKTKQQSIQRLESEAINIEAEEAKTQQKIRQINTKKCHFLAEMKNRTKEFQELGKEKVRLSLRFVEAAQEVEAAEKEQREQSGTLQNLQREFEVLQDRVGKLKDTAKKLLTEAKKGTETPANEDLSDGLKEAFSTLPETLEEIDTLIHEKRARAECTFSADENVVREYQQRKLDIARISKENITKEKLLQRRQQDIEDLKDAWLGPLRELVAKISQNFTAFFRTLRCAGEVDLAVPDNPNDFEKYGIRIKVKFRDSEPLRELTATHQSGGEKSVATVLYMMALQELTPCPFRCVDEINQGMDPHNERKVFELVVKTACRENTSQYFLLTPKLLPDLDFTERMTILCIYNGPALLNHTEWSVRKFLRRRAHLPAADA